MTANWFEAKVKYVKMGEDGKEKKWNILKKQRGRDLQ